MQPQAENFAVLLRNTADNPNVHALKAALWKSDASLVVEHGVDDNAWVSTSDRPLGPAIVTLADLPVMVGFEAQKHKFLSALQCKSMQVEAVSLLSTNCRAGQSRRCRPTPPLPFKASQGEPCSR